MLNDEIDEVRIGSLVGIASFNQVMKLKEKDVDTVLFNLTEDNLVLRNSIYKFFGEIVTSDPEVFKSMLAKILVNLERYEGDQHHIFKLMQKLGINHSKMIVKIYH